MAPGHLVAHGDHPLGGNVDLDHLQHAAAELVAPLHRVQRPVAGVDRRLDRRPAFLVDLLDLGEPLGAADVQRLQAEPLRLFGQEAVLLALGQGLALVVGERLLEHPFDLLDELAEGLGDPRVALVLGLFQRILEGLALLLGKAHPAGEFLRIDDDPLDPRGDFERVVLDVFPRPAEDRVEQLLLRSQLGLRLRRDLAHEDVAGPHVGPHADDAVLVEIPQGFLADVGDVAREFLPAELRLANLHVEFLDMDRRVGVVLDQLLADDDRVLEVVPVPGHERPQNVPPQGQFSVVGPRPVGDHVALVDLLTDLHDRLLVLASPLVQADELAELVDVAADLDPAAVHIGHRAFPRGADQHARILGGVDFQPRRHQRRFGDQQGNRLPLHVRAHQRAVRVVVFEERDQAGGNADHLARRHVHVLHTIGRRHGKITPVAGDDRIADKLAVAEQSVGGRQQGLVLLVGPQPDDLVGHLPLDDFPVGGHKEAVLIHAGIDRQAGNQADVRAFRGLDRADSPVVRDVHIADLEAGALAVQAAGPEGRQPPLVREHRERVRLVDDLGEFAAAEEVLDRRRNALRVDQAPRRHVLHVLQAHPLLDGAAELEEPLAQLVGGQLVDRPQPAVAEMVDVVDLRGARLGAERQQVAHRGDQIVGAEGHFLFGHAQAELAIDAKPPHPAEPVAIRIVELLVEQGLGLLQLRRIAGAEPLVNPQQRLLVAGCRVVGQRVEQQLVPLVVHHRDRLQSGRADLLGDVLGDLLAAFDDDFAGPLAVRRIDHVANGQLAFDLRGAPPVDDPLRLGLVEGLENRRVVAVRRVHRAEQRHRRELSALVDADREALLPRDVQLDPAAPFGDHAAAMQLALAGLHLGDEVDSRAAVQLADDDPFGAVDDELAAAEHDRDVAEVDLLLDRLVLRQAEPDLERAAVRQTELAAFVGLVARLAEFVAEILQPERLVVALDREDLPQHALQPLVLPLRPVRLVLEELGVALGLDRSQIGRFVGGLQASKMTDFLGLKTPLCRGSHRQ